MRTTAIGGGASTPGSTASDRAKATRGALPDAAGPAKSRAPKGRAAVGPIPSAASRASVASADAPVHGGLRGPGF